MTAKEYAKRYELALSYKVVAERAFNAGMKAERNSNKTDQYRKMEDELIELRAYKKETEAMLSTPEGIAELIGGL